jgi:actin, other eukaryote
MTAIEYKDKYYGDEAHQKRGVLTLTKPIQRGFIINHEDMNYLWERAFYVELRESPEDHPLIITDS